jgi:hypothetical protein
MLKEPPKLLLKEKGPKKMNHQVAVENHLKPPNEPLKENKPRMLREPLQEPPTEPPTEPLGLKPVKFGFKVLAVKTTTAPM